MVIMKSSGIGGQAVLEGVMMKNKSQYSVAVRKPNGEISVTTGTCSSIADKNLFFRLPVIRGVVAFAESLVLGMRTLTYSADFLEEEESAGEEKSSARETVESVLIVVLAVVLAVAVFMLLPLFLSEFLRRTTVSETVLAVVEGGIRIVLFVGYVMLISCMRDIKRVFMYHGAEHKTINCVERGLTLNVENVRKQSKQHRRCGTSFLLVVMFVSVIFFLFIRVKNLALRMLFRVLLIPVIAGVSYEFIRLAGNTDNKLVVALSQPGLWLQRLTTREPDDAMLEVAIASVEAVFDWQAYQQKMREQAERRSRRRREKLARARAEQSGTEERKKKTRAQKKKELAEREMQYRKRTKERDRLLKEQEEKDAKRQMEYQAIKERKAARMAATRANAPAPKVEMDSGDDLSRLDHFFSEKDSGKK